LVRTGDEEPALAPDKIKAAESAMRCRGRADAHIADTAGAGRSGIICRT
jgi:hypothetical protein